MFYSNIGLAISQDDGKTFSKFSDSPILARSEVDKWAVMAPFVLKEKDISPQLPEDLTNLMRKAVKLGEHLKINNKDVHNTRSLRLTEAKILRLAKYYRSNNQQCAN